MKRKVCLTVMTMIMAFCSIPAKAELFFYDSFTRSSNLAGSLPDTGGDMYAYVHSAFDATETAVSTGGDAYMAVESKHSGAFVNFSVRSSVAGLNYSTSPVFYVTATFKSSDMFENYTGHLGVEVGIDVTKSGESLVRQQQIGLGRADWYGDSGAGAHMVAWGSGSSASKKNLGDYTLGNTVMLALKFEEKQMNLPTVQYSYEIFAGVVSSSGAEPVWTKIATEANKPQGYSLDYIGLNVGGTNGGDMITHSGYIDEIKVGRTWNDVPEPATLLLLGIGSVVLRKKRA